MGIGLWSAHRQGSRECMALRSSISSQAVIRRTATTGWSSRIAHRMALLSQSQPGGLWTFIKSKMLKIKITTKSRLKWTRLLIKVRFNVTSYYWHFTIFVHRLSAFNIFTTSKWECGELLFNSVPNDIKIRTTSFIFLFLGHPDLARFIKPPPDLKGRKTY